MNTRIEKIVDAVKKNGHDGIVINKGSDIKYLTGYRRIWSCSPASDRTEKLFCNRRTV